MIKKITSIAINNFRGYFGEYAPIKMSKGENLLIYGENGSGKSSLYKALNNFFASSRNSSVLYTKNRYLINKLGTVKLQFSDYDLATNQVIVGTDIIHSFSDVQSDHNVLFIQNTALIKGFLDYTDLLKVYFHNESEPNLFELIILNLLGEHIPHKTGGNFRFKERWDQLQNDLINNAYNRNDRCHVKALANLPTFEIHLRGTLDNVFVILNKYLSDYFNELHIRLDYSLEPITFNYGSKWEWNTTSEFKLKVIKDGIPIIGGYNDFLNEARLSAIAVCLYLASLRTNPSTIELKVIFLDDVFIGLDAGNRIPILNILRNEFSDYQKIISTYDRHWFELAKRYFDINDKDKWKVIEMYVGSDTDPLTGSKISKPIIVEGESYYDRAIRYLNHRSNPDYPAASNYFRKAFENLLSEYMPSFWAVDGDFVRIPEYKLGFYLNKLQSVFKNIGADSTYINAVNSLLHVLLHPLSHHEITSPIYKQEIEIISHAYLGLKKQLVEIDLKANYKCKLESNSLLKITFTFSNTHNQYYEILLNEPLVLDVVSNKLINVKCNTKRYGGVKDELIYGPISPSKKKLSFRYLSIEDAVYRIHTHITQAEGNNINKPDNYLSVVEYFNNTSWHPLIEILN